MKNVDEFLNWLKCNLDRVFSDEAIQRSISTKLQAIDPGLRWEVGPHDDKTNFFAFSPNLDISRLDLTDSLVQAAPNIPGWVFLAAKPRKQWKSRKIQLKDASSAIVTYHLDEWLYYLTSFKDGEFFDVNIVPVGYEQCPIDDLRYVASLLVEFELGERTFIEFVDQINIVLPTELHTFGNKIENLHAQMLQELSKKTHH